MDVKDEMSTSNNPVGGGYHGLAWSPKQRSEQLSFYKSCMEEFRCLTVAKICSKSLVSSPSSGDFSSSSVHSDVMGGAEISVFFAYPGTSVSPSFPCNKFQFPN